MFHAIPKLLVWRNIAFGVYLLCVIILPYHCIFWFICTVRKIMAMCGLNILCWLFSFKQVIHNKLRCVFYLKGLIGDYHTVVLLHKMFCLENCRYEKCNCWFNFCASNTNFAASFLKHWSVSIFKINADSIILLSYVCNYVTY